MTRDRNKSRNREAAPPDSVAGGPVAIIGVGMRLPGADSLAAFWAHLAAGRSLISEVPARRWDAKALRGNPAKENKTNSIWGGFLDDADAFDAAFFNVSPREASWMDPQQRFALEMAWHAIEDAGLRASALAGSRTGVYMGVCHWDYAELIEKHLTRLDAYTPTGIAFSVIANRVSHFFDLRGPSVTNDTACAASLVSIYEAVRALQNGDCDLALAGGVNLAWSPNHFIAFAKSGMLSKDGKAKAFDARADGYVRGEGGAMLLLKPLARAEADGDPIHAVIAGIGVNHGGRTSSLTVTNPTAQAELIAEVHREAGIGPESFSYIEAHGPGTPLGDPIEIAGLKAAFRMRAAETEADLQPGSCGIGSVKTNIGHLEGAAGVAGVVKVLAAMHHEALPPNVGFETLNPLIDLTGTPFRIQSETTPWPRKHGTPRCAGISSFGFGGTNAHAVLEDIQVSPRAEPGSHGPLVLPVSARTDHALRASARALDDFLGREPDVRLADLALTLQTGREVMAKRVAFVVESIADLRDALVDFIAGEPDTRVRLPGGEAAEGEPWRAADLWAGGADATFAAPPGARRVNAPLYPFERQRHWIDTTLGAKAHDGVPHPLLHRNVSSLDAAIYRSRFTGSEFFFAGHEVRGTQVLPGVVALEMARAAYVAASGFMGSVRLTDLVWTRPIAAGDAGVDVEVRLTRLDGDGVAFAVSTLAGDAPGAVCVQGRVSRGEGETTTHDLAHLHTNGEIVDPQVCYERLRASGVVHGPDFQALTAVRRGGGFVVADLRVPRRLAASLPELPLHPILLDAAIQAWVALEDRAPSGAGVPFACREIVVAGVCETAMTAYVRSCAASKPAGGILILDIDICDRDGRVCVAFKGLALRLVSGAASQAPEAALPVSNPDRHGLVLAQGVWAETPFPPQSVGVTRDTTVFLAGRLTGLMQALRAEGAEGSVTGCALPDPVPGDPAATAGIWFRTVHAHLADLMAAKPKRHHRTLVLVPGDLPTYLAAPLVGLFRTVALEHPKLSGAVVRVGGTSDGARLARIIWAEAGCADTFAEVGHRSDGQRLTWRAVAATASEPEAASPRLDPEGVYWITGGIGGLGLIFADALIARGARRIVLSGRSEKPDVDRLARMETFRARGVEVRYQACDVADRAAVDALVASIKGGFGPLKGVIHAAGVLDDAYIFGADPARIAPVLAPKVAGTLAIDAATANLDLSFFVLCSSVASAFGNAGQGSYAGANAFLDAFAEHRAALVARGERRGVTRAIAWPLWAKGGMTVDAPFVDALRRRFGTDPLPSAAGVDALCRALSDHSSPRPVVLYGDRARIGALLADAGKTAAQADIKAPDEPTMSPGDAGLLDRTLEYLKELLSDATQIDTARIRGDTPLVEYGLDSIVIVDITARLERVTGPLSKTLFFEYVTLASLAAHLVDEHAAALAGALPPQPPSPAVSVPAAAHPAEDVLREPPTPQRPASSSTSNDTHDVAIIGLSLRVAQAANKDAFWEMLSKGQHAVGPVPRDRWDHDAIYHPERDVLGKTVVKTGAFLDGIDKFDPRYFRISQAEAELMSPEVRLFLEASVEAFEDAGYSREAMQTKFGGDVAVLVGSMTNEYDYFGFQNMLARGARASGSYTGTVPNMVSYFYGFTGPSYFLDTMCSAASTCIHEAVHMLRSGRCQMALAGGVSLLLHPQKLIAVSQEHFTSKTAEVVRGYGLGADGTILGEGVGALVLKRRADAERDGDHVYGIIKGTAVTNAGVRNGFTVPSPAQQAAAVAKAIEDAGIDPRTIGYVEGHGSGTALGDPIEIRALTQAYRAHTPDTQFCPIGTVKSNVAHLLAAAGVAGVAKVLMQLKHGQLAPSLHAETLNPDIPFEKTPFYVQRELAPWKRIAGADGRELPRRAGVTSIGAGGMNSHILIEEHIALPRAPHPGGAEIAVLSAMNAAALVRLVLRMRGHIASHPELSLADIAFTLQVGRNALPCRLAVVAESREDLIAKLDAFAIAPGAGERVWFTPSTLDREPHVPAERVKADVAARSLDRVAAYWAEGVAVDWDALQDGRQPHRVSLPSYPFERVRCWYPEFEDAPSVLRPLGARREASEPARIAADAPSAAVADDPDEDLRSELTALAAGLLKFEQHQIGPRVSFYDLGFDSISLTRFAALIGERFGVPVSPAIFFECEHVDALCRHLASRGARARMADAVPHQALAVTERPAPIAAETTPSHHGNGRMKVAIVGVACRLPGAGTPDAFIDRLLAGDDLTSEFPLHRYGEKYAERLRRAGFAKRGGFLADVDRFDAAFFRVSPVEAERMDPQQRLMLETAWRALENAGYRPGDLPRDTAVFVGVSGRDYASLLEAHDVPHDGFAATGNSLAMVANRVSYQLDVHGASEAIDTACSSSLVALMRGADALAAGSCSMALVGGVNLALSVEGFEGPHLAGMLSPEGRCKTFSADADGYARGEGAVALLLKPLAAAEADGDNIIGVLVGGAVNHGGRAGALTAPSAKAQADLIARAMDGIDPASIGFIETHGTGTALGDPVEISGLRLAFERLSEGKPLPPIALGAVKSNIGHLEAAAGLAGVVKVLGAMERGELPPTLHCSEINPHIELDGSPFVISRNRAPWPSRVGASQAGVPRRAGVSSFGFGGVNAHVVLEHYPGGGGRRPKLPERGFAGTRFWIPGSPDEPGSPSHGTTSLDETVLLAPRWSEAALSYSAAASSRRRLVLACGVAVPAAAGCRVVDCGGQSGNVGSGDIGNRYITAAATALSALQDEMRKAEPVLVQLVHPLDCEEEVFSGIGALLDTASQESTHILGQVIGVSNPLSPALVGSLLEDEARHPHQRRIRREANRRLVRTWEPLSGKHLEPPVWRDGGVYLITGGMGGIGRVLATEIASRAKSPVLVLVGRAPLDASRTAFLEVLRGAGARASYHALDVAEPAAVASLVADVVSSHGSINGVFHCAGALRDRTLLNKTRADLEAVLAPKVLGALALGEACKDQPLDSFVLFSSLAGALGNAGQGDYAAANGFLDAFAAARRDKLPVVAVNWPLWADGGMRMSDAGKAALFEQMGQRPLSTERALAALGGAIACHERQVAVVAGDGARIRAFFAAEGNCHAVDRDATPAQVPSSVVAPSLAEPRLVERTTDALRHLFARVSGVAAARIETETPLDEYGIDSLMITRLNRELGDEFGTLSATLLFEHRTLGALARHLAIRHADGCRRLTGETAASAHQSVAEAAAVVAPKPAAQKASPEGDRHESIAIIGMSGRYPGADDLDTFWENLAAGRDLIREVPEDRWPLGGFFEQDVEAAVARGASYAKWGGFLEDFAGFDPLFFKISPRDAAAMDPQERLFLMAAWAACEDAGYSRSRLAVRHDARVGVYVGVTKTGFALHGPFTGEGGVTVRPTTSFASIANRVSHVLDLSGPSMPVDTMCSSSLTAIHEACAALRAGSCAMALAGGVNLYLHPSNFVELSAARMLSPDGRCRSFGKGANGFVPGEGVGCVLLKPLSRALADGDRIHAVIRGTAINHGGRTNGYTVPNPSAQRDVIRAALDDAGLDARSVTCIEAHGTGTDLGDPIEVTALVQAFEGETREHGFCALGSVKSNIGHLEAAAGIAGLTKVVLQMQHGLLAPTLHAGTPNPKVNLDTTPFKLQTALAPWTADVRIAGVSSFGAGGANAHVVLEEWQSEIAAEAPAHSGPSEAGASHAIVLSARNPERLRIAAVRLLAVVEKALSGHVALPRHDSVRQDSLAAALHTKLAELLDVAPEQVDDAETFETLGFDRVHRLALRDWLESRFGVSNAAQIVRDAETPEQLMAALCEGTAVSPPGQPAEAALDLADIAFTLQVGREAMDARLAIETMTLEGLAAALGAFSEGRTDHPGLHSGNAQDHRAVIAALGGDEDIHALAQKWVARGSLGRLLALWVQGLPVDWEDLPRSAPARIVSLPTYPFARDRYWVPVKPAALAEAQDSRQPDRSLAETAALSTGADRLDAAIAPLVRAIVAGVSTEALVHPFDRWRAALANLLPPGEAVSPERAWETWSRFKSAAPSSLASQIALAETMLAALPDVLSGVRSAPSIMFPAGRLDLVEAVYKENPIAARFSAALARAAADWVRGRLSAEPGVALRVLEIGAGTGGTSEHLFETFAPFGDAIVEYRYTDVSRAFLIKAEQRFCERVPHLATAIFDAEKPPAAQGIATAHYDLVVAANVLHATADIRSTLRHVRETLAPGGALLLNETSRATLFTHVTFGLLDGWWRFADADLRIPGTPALSAASWRSVLEGAGFIWRSVSSENERRLGQQIIIAEAPGQQGRRAPMAGARRDTLRRLVAETLNMPVASVAPDKPFADYGLDSILGAELVERIRTALGVKIEQTRLYDFGSVSRLDAYIAEVAPEVLAPEAIAPEAVAPLVSPAPIAAPAVQVPHVEITDAREPIAIVGVSGRFAQSPDLETLWRHLEAGRNLVEPVKRFATAGERHGSFIDGIDHFDPVFFGISGLEATYMDPQQRLFLEEAWKALEHAGHAGAAIEGRRCGVFVGCSAGDYQELFKTQPPGQAFWGNTSSLIPARIAYCLDLKGPAIAVDTACSSSLVALDLACRSLWSGESEFAIAGGVFVQCTDRFFRYADAASMLSPLGRCAAFGDAADGIVPGEAVAAVVLRPLSRAIADGDTIHGVIVGSGTNQDGATNGITAPSGISQQSLMRDVYDAFGIDPAGIGYVEAHGTGTRLGDPIEYEALANVFSGAGAAKSACLLGSVKSNVGHATTAAGITGLVKVLGALKTGVVPPTLHVGSGNSAIRFSDGPFRVNTKPELWPEQSAPRRAAISSFGFSGTNAHVVVEQAPYQTLVADQASAHLVVLSARTSDQLRQQAERLVGYLANAERPHLRDVAFTLLTGRRHLAYRLAVVARNIDDLASRLTQWLAGSAGSGVKVAAVAIGVGRSDAETAADRGDLPKLAEAFLSGSTPDADRLFAGSGRRRVPLPTYPFAQGRYWVEETSVQPAAKNVAPVSLTAPVASERSEKHRLLDPVASVVKAMRPALGGNPGGKVTLAPLDGRRPLAAAHPKHVERNIDAHGVCRLAPADPWSRDLETGLVEELRAISELPDVRAVLLSVPAAWGAPPEPCEHEACDVTRFSQAVLGCSIPVVAAVACSCRGAGLVAALACDFVVLAAEGCYAASGVGHASDLTQRRLGADLARNLLGGRQSQTGSELRSAGLALPVVSRDRVDEEALRLARAVARAPRLALVELKRHMRSEPLQAGGAVPAREALRPFAVGGEAVEHGSAERIALASTSVVLEAFGEGVVVLRMEERSGRNTFTTDLMDGLCEAFAAIARSPAFKAVVLTGFDGYFACGGTVDGLESLQRGETHFTDRRIYSLPLECPLPVIAAMQGHAIGAGWALGMFCDLALFGAESVYHSNYMELGFTPGAGATLVFPRRLGDDLGREVLFSAVPFKGRDLKVRAPGLHVMPSASVLPEALKMAHRLAQKSRDTLVSAKAEAARPLLDVLPQTLARELDMHRRTFIGNEDTLVRIRAAFPKAPAVSNQPGQTAQGSGDRLTEVRSAVVESLAEELMIGAADIRDGSGFLDLGLDSILAVTWIRRLNARFGIDLPATAVYAQPTVGALVKRIADLLPAEVTSASAPPPLAAMPARHAQPEANRARVPEPARERVRDRVVASLAEELMIDAADIRDGSGFLDLGLDSILAVTWIRRLNAAFGTDLPATAVYANPTVGALIDRLSDQAPPMPPETPPPAPAMASAPAAPVAPEPVAEPRAAPIASHVQRSGTKERTAIAVIGMSGRFPKAPDLATFWDNIRNGRDCISEIPPQRWDISAHYDPDPQAPGKSYSKWMGAIDGVESFDAAFFNITPREAELMDPQQRLFLQHAWHAIEDAGADPTSLAGAACGVFVGSGPSGYADLIEERNAYSLLGSAGSILAARIAYLLDLTGPAVSLDTACSSSLVAIAEACNSLVLGDSDLALAGGACVLIGPSMFIDTSKVSMLSKDGRCFTFDARANGFVPGEGVGVMLLKRLDDALRDGDPVRAVIRGWGVNQDGKTNGIAAPNPQAQTRLIRGIHERFGIDPRSVGLIECHGTGTALGDPIEIEGLAGAFGGRAPEASCAIGSVKSNVGHLLASAGVAGAMKAVLAVQHAELPPTIHVEHQNPHLAIAGTPFFINTEAKAWSGTPRTKRRAAVSAFGFSGTNAHIVIEEAPARETAAGSGPWVLPLSARTADRICAYAADLKRFVAEHPALDLASLAATFQHGRAVFAVRRAITFHDRAGLLRALDALAADPNAPVSISGGALDVLTQRWLTGDNVTWPVTDASRIQAPGYPFAEERYWVEQQISKDKMAEPFFALEARGDGALLAKISKDHADTGALIDDGLAGLLLPEIVRAAGRRALGREVLGLKHMIWGPPGRETGQAPCWSVTLRPDSGGVLYEVSDERHLHAPHHLGELILDPDDLQRSAWPARLDERRLSSQGRNVTHRWRSFSGSSIRALAGLDVADVYRHADDVVARVQCGVPPSESALLRLTWRLIAFSDMNGHRPPPTVPFAVERFVVTGETLPREFWVRIGNDGTAKTVAVQGLSGEPVLLIDGLIAREADDMTEIDVHEEMLL